MFRSLIARLKQNQLVSHSAVFFIGTVLANVGNYFFHLIMARLLGVPEYGELQSLLSLMVIFSIPFAVINIVIVNYAAPLQAAGAQDQLRRLWRWTNTRLLLAGGGFGLLVIAIATPVSHFLNLSSTWSVMLIGLSGVMALVVVPNRAFLQGTKKFVSLSANIAIEVAIKVIGAGLLVWLGWRLMGALSGMVVGALCAYAVSFLPLRYLWSKPTAAVTIDMASRDLFKYSGPVIISRLCLTLLYALDVILAKHFLTPELAGYYGGLAVLGRMGFFLTSPIAAVMFSLGSEHRIATDQTPHRRLVGQTLLITGLIAAAVVISYLLLPKLFIFVLLGEKFYVIADYLWPFALIMVSYSLINVLVHSFLSIHQLRFVPVMVGGVIAEAVALWFWHDSITTFLWVLNAVMVMVLFGLSIEYWLRRPTAVVVKTAPPTIEILT